MSERHAQPATIEMERISEVLLMHVFWEELTNARSAA